MRKHFSKNQINVEARNCHIIKNLQDKIEELRIELTNLASLEGLQGEQTLKKSRELDQLLNRYYREKLEFEKKYISARIKEPTEKGRKSH
ncbi:Spo0E family sporulation regulatory protein-aspartic acid phosphatase [Paenibacillus septentrionalis]|uniref:Spo0E family sporulation regulatory protein-aspartic acid phosphatase n=1 Tax=Paenibacillus septentrionalis TaxID=429342 RepID=A0ABW1V356_9BACL